MPRFFFDDLDLFSFQNPSRYIVAPKHFSRRILRLVVVEIGISALYWTERRN